MSQSLVQSPTTCLIRSEKPQRRPWPGPGWSAIGKKWHDIITVTMVMFKGVVLCSYMYFYRGLLCYSKLDLRSYLKLRAIKPHFLL
jgi:hypothetical protein